MAITYVKTENIVDIKNEVDKLTEDYKEEYINLFKRLSLVTTNTQEWIGNQADFYFNNIMKDKNDFENVYNELKRLVEKLERDADLISKEVNHSLEIEASRD